MTTDPKRKQSPAEVVEIKKKIEYAWNHSMTRDEFMKAIDPILDALTEERAESARIRERHDRMAELIKFVLCFANPDIDEMAMKLEIIISEGLLRGSSLAPEITEAAKRHEKGKG